MSASKARTKYSVLSTQYSVLTSAMVELRCSRLTANTQNPAFEQPHGQGLSMTIVSSLSPACTVQSFTATRFSRDHTCPFQTGVLQRLRTTRSVATWRAEENCAPPLLPRPQIRETTSLTHQSFAAKLAPRVFEPRLCPKVAHSLREWANRACFLKRRRRFGQSLQPQNAERTWMSCPLRMPHSPRPQVSNFRSLNPQSENRR
jgi:hypothetical protein